jgi:iron complex outermembrane receptor protein
MKKALLLLISFAGVAHAQPKVDVGDLPPLPAPTAAAESGDVTVAAAAAAEEDVVVGAAKREQSLGNVASAVTVISGDRLRRFGYRSVAEALRGIAGVFVDDDHMSERVGIRGLQPLGDFNTRILVLVDGATVTEPWAQFAGVGWDAPIDIDDVARIEIIRGPVSSLYGTNAFFGIINIVTKGADQMPKAWARISSQDYTTTGAQAGGAISAGFSSGNLRHQVRGSIAAMYRGGETLSVPEIGNDLTDDKVVGMNGSLVASSGGAFVQLRGYRRVRDLPFYPYLTTVGTTGNNNTDEQAMLEGGYTRQVASNLSVTGRVYANRYRFSDYLRYDTDPNDPTTIDVFRDFGDSKWLGAEVRTRWDILPKNELGLTAGAEGTYIYSKSHSFDQSHVPDSNIPKSLNTQGVYAEVDGEPLSWFAFSGGARYDRNSLFENRTSPRAALFVNSHDRYGLKALYAEGFRSPSPYEGYFADGISLEANPALKAETIKSYEGVAWGKPLPGMSLRFSAFEWDATDLMVSVTDMNTGFLQYQNVASLTSKGVEGEMTYRNAAGWLGFGGFSVDKVRDERLKYVPGAPWLTASGGVSTPPLWGRANLSTEVDVVGPRRTRTPGLDSDTFVLWDAILYAPDLMKNVDLTIGCRNLLGIREQLPAQPDYDRADDMGNPITTPILPGEGRELYARIGYRY